MTLPERIESYNFSCEAGKLQDCLEWRRLKHSHEPLVRALADLLEAATVGLDSESEYAAINNAKAVLALCKLSITPPT